MIWIIRWFTGLNYIESRYTSLEQVNNVIKKAIDNEEYPTRIEILRIKILRIPKNYKE